ncbi:uncharacterized protein F4822DRAFT_374426 [Hypoxylon trugodes]|uniref:uncharacterized protein n=1 Tax=Hypoxylon trugodes TaxID=326681 RepID=UPI00219AAB20|nr:uncharacterized protein F4822DRAFT_374426 [Hypoxylon trugodes]KAI1384830.1 hypothetical protein F4822DRAFT_374426 [Hypoxylon trugodes]
MEEAGSHRTGATLIPTPTWFIALRVLQIVFSLVAVAMAGWWIHGLYEDELGFVIVSGLFTWIIAVYALLSEKVVSCQRAYNTWAILVLDSLMIIFWLAAMAANANLRSKFSVKVNASCVSDGSAINSGHCSVVKRNEFASDSALAVLSGVAGISALIMLLFVATFAYVCHFFRLSFSGHLSNDPEKASGAAAVAVAGGPGATELQGGMPPQNIAAQQSQPLLHQQPSQQWGQQTGYPQQSAGQPQYPQGQAYDPYAPQNTAYAGAAGVYPQPEPPYNPGTSAPGQPYVNQGPYSPQGTPAPGQPYQPPYNSTSQ